MSSNEKHRHAAKSSGASLDPRLAELARVLGRALARRRLQEHRAADSAAEAAASGSAATDLSGDRAS